MPYFSWIGIDLQGNNRKGSAFALNSAELDQCLLVRDIALLACKKRRVISFKPITGLILAHFFSNLRDLLAAGLSLPDALHILINQTQVPRFQAIIAEVYQQIKKGVALHDALQQHRRVFTSLMVHVVFVGSQSGSLLDALALLSDYLMTDENTKKQVRKAVLMPCVTLAFFCGATLFIFLVIIPQFIALFASINNQLPPLTQVMLTVSNAIRHWSFWFVLIVASSGVAVLFGVLARIAKRELDYLIMRLPVIGAYKQLKEGGYFLQVLGLMLCSGVSLVHALKIAQGMVSNSCIADAVAQVSRDVQQGSSLTAALSGADNLGCSTEIQALIAVGEQSGNLGNMISRAAQMQRARLHERLMVMTTLINPMLMLFMAFLVGALIFSVYLPIFNLASFSAA